MIELMEIPLHTKFSSRSRYRHFSFSIDFMIYYLSFLFQNPLQLNTSDWVRPDESKCSQPTVSFDIEPESIVKVGRQRPESPWQRHAVTVWVLHSERRNWWPWFAWCPTTKPPTCSFSFLVSSAFHPFFFFFFVEIGSLELVEWHNQSAVWKIRSLFSIAFVRVRLFAPNFRPRVADYICYLRIIGNIDDGLPSTLFEKNREILPAVRFVTP